MREFSAQVLIYCLYDQKCPPTFVSKFYRSREFVMTVYAFVFSHFWSYNYCYHVQHPNLILYVLQISLQHAHYTLAFIEGLPDIYGQEYWKLHWVQLTRCNLINKNAFVRCSLNWKFSYCDQLKNAVLTLKWFAHSSRVLVVSGT